MFTVYYSCSIQLFPTPALAILVYRVFRNYRKLPIKVLHAVLHILAFLFAVVAVKAVFEFHDSRRIPNLYSLHSWIGLVALVLFGVQVSLRFIRRQYQG